MVSRTLIEGRAWRSEDTERIVSTRIPQLKEKSLTEEQTFRSENNGFLPLRRLQLLVPCVTASENRGGEPSVKKDFELNTPVSSLLQVCRSLSF